MGKVNLLTSTEQYARRDSCITHNGHYVKLTSSELIQAICQVVYLSVRVLAMRIGRKIVTNYQ